MPGFAIWLVTAVFLGFVALCHLRTRLVIGDRGFRWDKPWRPFQTALEVPWSQVSACDVDATYTLSRTWRNWLVLTLSDGRHLSLGRKYPVREFAANWWAICDLMEARRKTYRAADPVGEPAANA
jgi:hypothetical protein